MNGDTAIFFLLFCVLAIVFGALFLRHRTQQMFHEERMAALEKGTAVPLGRAPAPWSPRVYLLRGLIWTFGGAALTICLLGIAAASHRPLNAETVAWRAKDVSRNLEIPLDQARQMVEKDAGLNQGPPNAIALLGLIPLGVGLAYLIFYYSDGSRNKLPVDTSRAA